MQVMVQFWVHQMTAAEIFQESFQIFPYIKYLGTRDWTAFLTVWSKYSLLSSTEIHGQKKRHFYVAPSSIFQCCEHNKHLGPRKTYIFFLAARISAVCGLRIWRISLQFSLQSTVRSATRKNYFLVHGAACGFETICCGAAPAKQPREALVV